MATQEEGVGTRVARTRYSDLLSLTFDVLDARRNPNFAWQKCELGDDRFNVLLGTCDGFERTSQVDGLADGSEERAADVALVGEYKVEAAYPNPFNPRSQFSLVLKRDQQVRIMLYDVTGKVVKVIHDGHLSSNTAHRFTIDGSTLSSGMYLYQITGEDFQEVRRVTLLK